MRRVTAGSLTNNPTDRQGISERLAEFGQQSNEDARPDAVQLENRGGLPGGMRLLHRLLPLARVPQAPRVRWEFMIEQKYLTAIKNFEGFASRSQWDYAQNTNGYGTRALYQGEVIDQAEAERRFKAEVADAYAIVDRFAPGLDEGTKAALTSLTFNAGAGWTRSGLGVAIKDGDLDTAKQIFLSYNKAGGEVLPGLVSRRQSEQLWFGGAAGSDFATDVGAVQIADEQSVLPPPADLSDNVEGILFDAVQADASPEPLPFFERYSALGDAQSNDAPSRSAQLRFSMFLALISSLHILPAWSADEQGHSRDSNGQSLRSEPTQAA